MCLSTITSRRTGTNLAVTKVYKNFEISKGICCVTCKVTSRSDDPKDWKLKCSFTSHVYTDNEIGVWIKASKGRIVSTYHYYRSYPEGFHAYSTRRRFCRDIPVEFRRIHTVGTQGNSKVLVAYEMRIPKNWRKYVR
jgi:hypothetical protein